MSPQSPEPSGPPVTLDLHVTRARRMGCGTGGWPSLIASIKTLEAARDPRWSDKNNLCSLTQGQIFPKIAPLSGKKTYFLYEADFASYKMLIIT